MINRDIKPLKYWVQKVLPLVYDDSLSHMELLNKVVQKLNSVIELSDVTRDKVLELEDFIHNSGLSVIVDDVLNEWVASGRFDEILNQKLLGDIIDRMSDDEVYARESTGFGVLHGLVVKAQEFPDMSVVVTKGVAHTYDGRRYVQEVDQRLAISPAHGQFARWDVVYITKDGELRILAGTPLASPVKPEVPETSIILGYVFVNAIVTIIIDGNVERVNSELYTIEELVDLFNSFVVDVEQEFNTVDNRITAVEETIDDNYVTLDTKITVLDEKVDDNQEEMNIRVTGLEETVGDNIDTLDVRVTELEEAVGDNIGLLDTRVTELEENVGDNIENIELYNNEVTGVGIINGLDVIQQTVANMSVIVKSGVAHLWNGKRYSQDNDEVIAISQPHNLYPRIDIVYINEVGILSYGVGTPNAVPVAGNPINGLILAEIYVSQTATNININNIKNVALSKITTNTIVSSLQQTINNIRDYEKFVVNDDWSIAINEAGKNGIVTFPTGNYKADGDIYLPHGAIGMGNVNITGTGNVYIQGEETTTISFIKEAIKRGTNSILITNGGTFSVGDYVLIKASLEEIENDINVQTGEINRVKAINGNSLVLEEVNGNNYEYNLSFTNQASVIKINPIFNTNIKNINFNKNVYVRNAIKPTIDIRINDGSFVLENSTEVSCNISVKSKDFATFSCVVFNRVRNSNNVVLSTLYGKDGVRLNGCCDVTASIRVSECGERGLRFYKSNNCTVKDWFIKGTQVVDVATNNNSIMFNRSIDCLVENGVLNEPNKVNNFASIEFRFDTSSTLRFNEIYSYSQRIIQYKQTTVNAIIENNKIIVKNPTELQRTVLTGDFSIVETTINSAIRLINNEILVTDFNSRLVFVRNVSTTSYTNLPFYMIEIKGNKVTDNGNPYNYDVTVGNFYSGGMGLEHLIVRDNIIHCKPTMVYNIMNLVGLYNNVVYRNNKIYPNNMHLFDFGSGKTVLDTDLHSYGSTIQANNEVNIIYKKEFIGFKGIANNVKTNLLKFEVPQTNSVSLIKVTYIVNSSAVRIASMGELVLRVARHNASGYGVVNSIEHSIPSSSLTMRTGETLDVVFSLSELEGDVSAEQSFYLELLANSSLASNAFISYSVEWLTGSASQSASNEIKVSKV